jgi:hypothetical protein
MSGRTRTSSQIMNPLPRCACGDSLSGERYEMDCESTMTLPLVIPSHVPRLTILNASTWRLLPTCSAESHFSLPADPSSRSQLRKVHRGARCSRTTPSTSPGSSHKLLPRHPAGQPGLSRTRSVGSRHGMFSVVSCTTNAAVQCQCMLSNWGRKDIGQTVEIHNENHPG